MHRPEPYGPYGQPVDNHAGCQPPDHTLRALDRARKASNWFVKKSGNTLKEEIDAALVSKSQLLAAQ
ncbi:hypothetical protein HH1059_04940 [Halorhodospira halochloris]|uniref:Uncharacterized protein n=1 Tax=Halorhodospira halochloris TaxID=1052 RepID=A0A2Z6EZF3_HALHR|nr:hypothetical protein HH1059_04940 [Halorhodospira halochloris]